MAKGPRYAVKFKRRREGKTNYRKRSALLKSKTPRLIVRKSNRYILVQFTAFDYKGDKTLLTVHSSKLKKLGWSHSLKSLPASYLTGLLAGKLAKKAKIENVVSDIGLYTKTKGGRIFATLKGALDSGLKLKLGLKLIPPEERISGAHISSYLKKDLEKDFIAVKNRILGQNG